MAGAALHVDVSAIDRIQERVDALAGIDRRELLDVIGATVARQTRRRIKKDKVSPDGTAWPQWSDRYAKTRHGNHSFLQGEGDFLDSIEFQPPSDDEVEVGSNLIYFATHQYGDEDRNIPARTPLGLSSDDLSELDVVILDWLREVLQ